MKRARSPIETSNELYQRAFKKQNENIKRQKSPEVNIQTVSASNASIKLLEFKLDNEIDFKAVEIGALDTISYYKMILIMENMGYAGKQDQSIEEEEELKVLWKLIKGNQTGSARITNLKVFHKAINNVFSKSMVIDIKKQDSDEVERGEDGPCKKI
jgi:acetolactate synthase regulatory subunit